METIWCLFTKFKFRGASQRWKYRHTQKNRIPDVLDFERRLREEENFWG